MSNNGLVYQLTSKTKHLIHRILHPGRDRHCLVLKHHNLAYARVPKAANTSIKHALYEMLFGRQEVVPMVNADRFWRRHPSGQADMSTIANALDAYPQLYVFSFVRSPYERVVSCYFNKIVCRDELPSFFQKHGFSKGMSFSDFVEKAVSYDDEVTDIHLCSQSHILSNAGEIYPDFIGRVENIDADWNQLREILLARSGLKLPELRRINVSRHQWPSVDDLFSDAGLRRHIEMRYASDFENFYPEGHAPSR